MNTFRLAFELIRYRPILWLFSFVMWTIIHGTPVLIGVLVGQVFDRLADGPVGPSPWTPVLIFAAIALGRNVVLYVGDLAWISYWNDQALQLRRNLLRWLLEAPGSRRIHASTGQAVSTFRDDVDDLLEYVENYVDLGGLLVFAGGAIGVMFSIDSSLTWLVLIPLTLTGIVTQSFSPVIRKRRRIMRAATEDVTGFIGETFGAVQSIKLAGREREMLDRFARLNEIRRRAALRDTFLTEAIRSINSNMATIGTAIVLLVAADRIGDTLSVGDLTVFLVFMPRLTGYLAFLGQIIAQHRRTGVAFERIQELAVDAPVARLLDRTRVPLRGDVVAPRPPAAPPPFQRLEVRDLTAFHPEADEGVREASFAIEAGSFTVITGKIGSGKTTLLRALLGLIPARGEVWWNGERVEDPALFLAPPRVAYTGQVPRLFSDTLGNNIALGRLATREHLREAVSLAILDEDLARLESGLDTMVGARGVKLSGGQIQRSAAARMFATEAQLLVFDDLSSALDVHTEAALWEGLFARRTATCLVVSHRRPALRRADRILVMDQGKIVDSGRLDELLGRSPVMREIWGED